MSKGMRLVQEMVCPSCRAALVPQTEGALRCSVEGTAYRRESGIWRLVDARGDADTASFLACYQAVRRDEGWGATDDSYYRALPFVEATDPHAAIWNIRAASYRLFVRTVMRPLEAAGAEQRVFDLGAGNGWLSYRLAERGHAVAAIDLNDDPVDGLGVRAYDDPEARFERVQASFEDLPWRDGVVDLAIYNGSFHYSKGYAATLREALRVLAPGGRVVIFDSPCYNLQESGEAMLRERGEAFRAGYGSDSGAVANEGFLTPMRLAELRRDVGVEWRVSFAYPGLRGALRPFKNRILGRREQARFPVVVGTLPASGL